MVNNPKPTILLLTGKRGEGKKEDLFLAKQLREHFNVMISGIADCKKFEDSADVVLVRNIWPTSNHLRQDREVLYRLARKKIKTYNPGIGEEDLIGKDYLVYLFKKGFPVIPTINEKSDIELLGKSKLYFIKPKHGGGREGCKKITSSQLHHVNFAKYVCQPFIDFKYEVSFYFIDNRFQYALYAPNKKKRWKLRELKTSRKDRIFARQFVDWNSISYGIQRIDACKTRDGKLLLVEIEDWCPYLSLLDINPKLTKRLTKNLIKSLKRVCN